MAQITQKLGFKASGAIRTLSNLSTKLDQAGDSLRRFKGVGGAVGGTGGQLDKVDKSLKKTEKSANNMAISWQTMARIIETQLIVRSITFLSQQLRDATERARELGLVIEEVQTISGRAKGSAQLSEDILAVSDAIAKAPTDIAEGLYQTLSNQVVKAGEALNFTSEAAKLATVTASETGDAVNALSSVMNSYGKSSAQAEHVAGTLFKTVELGRVRLNEMADIIGRVTPLTSELGITWEETAAAIATMTKQGVRADTAITQLRAVVNKLIKPSQNMLDLYEEWGVKTGKQAIETFGGLGGVLRKVQEETGGNTSEIAKLFRRVRAVTGVVSIMKEEGSLLADAMSEIAEGSIAATEAFDIFAQSDAQKLTKSIQEFENSMTHLGTKTMPILTKTLNGASWVVDNLGDGWLTITGRMDDSQRLANTYRENLKDAQEEIKELNREFAKNQRDRFKGLTEAARQYYLKINKEELALAKIRDDAMDRATSAYHSSLDNVVRVYEDAVKRIGKAVEDANDRIKSNSQEVANIQQRIEEKRLEGRLSKTENVYQKLRILDEEFSEAQRKAREATSEIDYTKESKERAKAAREVALGLAEQREQLAGQTNHLGFIQKYREDTIGELKGLQKIEKVSNERIKERLPDLKEQLRIRQEELGTLKDLVKQLKDLTKEGLVDSEASIKRINEVGEKITDILGSAKNSELFTGSLKLDEQTGLIKEGLQTAFDAAEINWEKEVARAKKAFSSAVIPIQTAVSAGRPEDAGETLGIQKRPEETETQYNVKLFEESKKLLKQQANLEHQIDKVRAKNVAKLDTSLASQGAINKILESNTRVEREMAKAAAIRAVQSGKTLDVEEETSRRIREQKPNLLELVSRTNSMNEKLKSGEKVRQSTLNTLAHLNIKAGQNNEITAGQEDFLRSNLKLIRDMNDSYADVNEIQKQMPEKEKLEVAKQTVNQYKALKRLEKRGVDLIELGGETLKRTLETSKRLKGSTDEVNTSMSNSADQASNVKTSVNGITQAITQAIGKANQLAGALAAASAASAGAAAGAAGAPTALAHHGGSMKYFASGGTARGQDKIAAMLGRGETVINSKDSKRFFSELNAINQGNQPVYREQGGSVTNVGDVNVTVNGGDTSQQTVREIGQSLRREIQRGTIKLR